MDRIPGIAGESANLHAQMMNLPLPLDPQIPADASQMLAYKLGHRDARHAAAELAEAHAADVSELREALIELCEAEEAAYPDEGSAAQKAWCERRHNARLHARLLSRATQGAQVMDFCGFPDCKCPMDPGPEPWCAKGLPHAPVVNACDGGQGNG